MEYPPTENPLNTEKHRSERLLWIRKHYYKIPRCFIYIYYMDGKYMYTTNRRNRIKQLLKGESEKDGIDEMIFTKIISQHSL